jgi:hypothetical protein
VNPIEKYNNILIKGRVDGSLDGLKWSINSTVTMKIVSIWRYKILQGKAHWQHPNEKEDPELIHRWIYFSRSWCIFSNIRVRSELDPSQILVMLGKQSRAG